MDDDIKVVRNILLFAAFIGYILYNIFFNLGGFLSFLFVATVLVGGLMLLHYIAAEICWLCEIIFSTPGMDRILTYFIGPDAKSYRGALLFTALAAFSGYTLFILGDYLGDVPRILVFAQVVLCSIILPAVLAAFISAIFALIELWETIMTFTYGPIQGPVEVESDVKRWLREKREERKKRESDEWQVRMAEHRLNVRMR